MRLSALVLAKNEEEMIIGALRQLSFVDEIIVLDQSSTDKTVRLAKKYTDKILHSDNQNFSQNRNILAKRATGDWLLYLDCDERLGKLNIAEILDVIKTKKHSAYYFPRKNLILGKWLKHGAWWPDYVPRLFLRDKLMVWEGVVHESPRISGSFGYLKHPIEHHTARDLESMFAKSIKWAQIEADLYYRSMNKPVTILRTIKFSLWRFIYHYFLRLGFIDGQVGLIAAAYQSLHSVMVLTYLWEMQNKTLNIKPEI